jgi:hypothetical protein
MKFTLNLLLFILAPMAAYAAEDGFVPMFHGQDLRGWVPCSIAPETFAARDGMIVTSGLPVGTLRTEKMYENFIIELEWRHLTAGGNSGLFIWADGLPEVGGHFSRGIEIQMLDPGYDRPGKNSGYTTHGDIFAVNGASLTVAGRISRNGKRSFPMEDRTHPSPAWNHYRVVANDGEIRLSVNGKEVTLAKQASPRKGYLMLEAEGAPVEFRNLRIKELPSTDPQAAEIAQEAEGFVPLFNSLDLRGWKIPEGDQGHWKVVQEVIDYDAQSQAPGKDKSLWSEEEYGDFQLIVDWRIKEMPYLNPRVYRILPDGSEERGADGQPLPYPQPDADSGIYLRGQSKYQVNIWTWPIGSGEMYGVRRDQSLPAEVRAGATPVRKADRPIGEWNRFDITVQGNTVTILLNGQAVVPGVSIPGLPPRGPLGLQHHGSQKDGAWTSPPSLVQFRNIYVRPLSR